jgi:putative ATPase
MRKLGYGEGYRYPHDSEDAINEQQYMPAELGERRYYEPSERGYEGRLGEYLERVRLARKSGQHSSETRKKQGG